MTEDKTLTYDPELGPGYFVQTRSDFLRSGAFTTTAKVLYQILVSYCGVGDTAFPGQDTLAAHMAVTRPTVRKAMVELEAAGLVEVKRRGVTRPNLYHVHKLPLLLRNSDGKNLADKRIADKRAKHLPTSGQNICHELHSVELDKEEIQDIPATVEYETMPLDEREAIIERYKRLMPRPR